MLTATMFSMIFGGFILCFMGYRFFRAAMTLGGLYIGGAIGYFVYFVFFEEPIFAYIFVLAGAGLLAFLSFKIYKKALFYVTMLFTSLVLLQSYLAVTHTGVLAAFFLSLFRKTAVGGASSAVVDASLPGESGEVGEALAGTMLSVSGNTNNLWTVFLISIAIGTIAGIVVCAIQRPAIIVMTAVYGSILLTGGIFSFGNPEYTFAMPGMKTAFDYLWQGRQLPLEILTAVSVAIMGALVQTRISPKGNQKAYKSKK